MTWRITPQAAGEAVELVLYGAIGDAFAETGVVAADVVKALNQHGRAKRIDVYVNSPGGNAFDGQAIYAALARHPGKVTVHVDGMAASAASIIAMAGDSIRMATGSLMMIHDPWTFALGNAVEMRKAADDLDRLRVSMADVYAARTGRKREEIEEAMSAETWFSAADAVAYGLATEVVAAKRAAACAVPDEIRARFRALPVLAASPPPSPSPAARAAVEELDRLTARMQATLATHRAKRLSA